MIKTLRTPWRHDPRSRRFNHHELFGTTLPSALPDTLGRPLRPVENQKNTLRCGGYGDAVDGGYMYGRRFHPDWQSAKIGELQGQSIDVSGADPNAIMRAERDAGFLPYELVPAALTLESNTIENTGIDAYKHIPVDPDDALRYRVAGFVSVIGPNDPPEIDTFDKIRSALAMAYDPVTRLGPTVHAFAKWYQVWSSPKTGIIPGLYDTRYFGQHHWLFVDFVVENGVPYLICHNSGSTAIGVNGFFKFPREVVNREFGTWGTSLKIAKTLTLEQIALAKQESPLGLIQRMILQAWYALSEIYINRGL